MLSATWIVDGLPAFAALRTRATDCDHWHVTGVEIRAESRNWSRRAIRRLTTARAILLACWIHLERKILLDDPLVVGDLRRRSLRVLHGYVDTAPGVVG